MTLQGIMWDVGREREGESSHTAGKLLYICFLLFHSFKFPVLNIIHSMRINGLALYSHLLRTHANNYNNNKKSRVHFKEHDALSYHFGVGKI
jgi:hypothetical protein